ncbi:MAG TPA: TonB-dependent siderophore receptor [Steroidobacteraceae bacterium]|nr:TonB-dependent siderophore receptor [Steroidobacteraceae bacterium]
MTDETRRNSSLRTVALLAGTGIGVLQLNAVYAAESESAADAPPNRDALEQVTVFGQKDDYKLDKSGLTKLGVPLIDVAQSIDTISAQEMQDRAVMDLNQALKTVPGVTIGAGEFRSLGTTPTIRGFVARTDMFMDGIRDYGNYYRDPFNAEAIEVLEGPAGVVFGRGSTGGVIEQDSKLPKLQPLIAGTLTGGTDSTRRATIDVNEPLTGLGEGAAFRINAMGHKAMVTDRNDVATARYGFAPSFSLGLGTPTRLTLAYFRQYNDDIPDYGLPYLGTQPAQVPRDNYYGFRDDFLHTLTDVATFKVEHDFSDAVTIQNQARYARYSRDFRFTEPLIAATVPVTTPLTAVTVTRNDNTGRSVDSMLWDQLNMTIRWSIGGIDNISVVGIEGGHERATPEFDNSSGVPTSPLLNPNENLDFSATSTFPRYKTHLTANSIAPYVIDTLKFNGAWEATIGLRYDHFAVDYNDANFSTTAPGVVEADHIEHTDNMGSYRGALAYKPAGNGSIYLAFGTSFNPSAEDLSLISSSRSFSLNNANLDPEKNRTYELGTKWAVVDNHLNLSAAIFRLEKENARVPDPTNVLLNILGGSQRVDGAELRAEGQVTAKWRIDAGYEYLDGRQTGSTKGAAPVGAPLMNTPKHALTLWNVYQVLPRFEVGGGSRFVSSQYTQNAPPIKTVPGFWTFDAMAKYAFTTNIAAQLNVNNLTNRYYYDQLHFFHVVPGEGRTALLSLNVRY